MADGNKSINATLTQDNAELLAIINGIHENKLTANVSDEINSLLYDYMTGLVQLNYAPLKTVRLTENTDKNLVSKVEAHRERLEELSFCILRMFASENNKNRNTGVFTLVEAQCEMQNANLRSKRMFEAGFDQFIESKTALEQFLTGKPLTYRFVLSKLEEIYMPDEEYGYDLSNYHYRAQWQEADYIVLKLYRETVKEALAYEDGKLIDYNAFNKYPTIATYRKALFRDTEIEWVLGDKNEEPENNVIRLYKENFMKDNYFSANKE